MKNRVVGFFIIAMITEIVSGQTADVISTVDISTIINARSSLLLGITYDARSSMRSTTGPIGYHDTNGVMLPEIQSIFGDFPMSTLRYPANAVTFGFDWKKSIGPAAKREAENIVGIGPAQPMKFGFDEFMTMTKAHGALTKDIQIMVTVYSTASIGLTQTQAMAAIDDAAQSAADWVEYANAPNNGKNWGGGIDWAAVRDSNGHPEPYGIELWNLGNEPWASGEFGNDSAGANKYIATIQPIMDSMLARDPSIKITVPATGPVTSEWNTNMLNHPFLKGKIYGLSPHFFPEETVVNGILPLGVAKVEHGLQAIADSAKAKGLKVIVGDYAHGIPTHNGAPVGDPDLAMQWQGANMCVDFLLLVSQIQNVERVNFWAYGLPAATWHPIRMNAPGNYTLMPAAVIYKRLFPLFLDHSVSVTTTSPKGSDGNVYSVRTGAFASSDTSSISVIAVNRDKNDTHTIGINGVSNYSISSVRLLTANMLASNNIVETIVSVDGSGIFTLPPMSVLLMQYQKNLTSSIPEHINHPNNFALMQNYPNPFNPTTEIRYQMSESGGVTLKVYDAIGREVATLVNEVKQAGYYSVPFDARQLSSGIYFYRLHAGEFVGVKKMSVLK